MRGGWIKRKRINGRVEGDIYEGRGAGEEQERKRKIRKEGIRGEMEGHQTVT